MIYTRVKPPDDIAIICEDLKVCGRSQLFSLLKFRHKWQHLMDQERKKVKSAADKIEKEANKKELNDSDLEAEEDKELEETIKRVEKERKKQDKKERERKVKAELRAKMSVIASTDIYNQNDEVLFDKKTLEKMKKIDIEELDFENDEENEEDPEGNGIVRMMDAPKKRTRGGSDDEGEDESDDDEMEPEQKRIESMAAGMDEYYSKQKEYMMDIDRQLQKKEKKRKLLIEQQRLKREDVSEEEELNNDDIRDEEALPTKKKSVKFDEDEEMESSDDDGLFVNPLLLKDKKDGKGKNSKKATEDGNESGSEGFSSADEDDERMLKKQRDTKKKKDDKALGKRKKRAGDEEDDVGDFFANTEIEVVPQSKIREKTATGGSDEEDGYESMDSEDMAETRALAKVMLRKKNRSIIADSTYNKFAVHEDKATLPDWFVEDEARHFRPNNVHLVTKDMVAEERKFLKEYNERPSKKVQEAKQRKKKRLAKAMTKIKNKATLIAEQQEMSEGNKMRQIQKLYKKEKSKNQEEKKYVVSRNFNNVGGTKTPRGTKAVDARMKKDMRATKAKAKRDKKHGGGGRRK